MRQRVLAKPKPLKARIPFFAGIAAAFIVVQDVLARTPFQAYVTVVLALVAFTLTASTGLPERSRSLPGYEPKPANRPFGNPLPWLFVFYSLGLLLINPSEQGVQNWLVWAILPAGAVATASTTTPGTFKRLLPIWTTALVIGCAGYLLIVAKYGLGYADSLYSARGAGWIVTIGAVPIIAAAATMGAPRWPAFLAVFTSATSLTRTTTAVGGALLLALAIRGAPKGRKGRVVFFAGGVVMAAYLAVTRVSAIQDRFTVGDGVAVGGLTINSSGRAALWSATYHGAFEHIWIGHGPGQAQYFILQRFVLIAHPHNEYLRLFYDTGLIGLAFWTLGSLALTRAAWKRYRATDVPEDRAIHLSAFLAMVLLLLGSLTDNLTVTVSFMTPIAALLGISLGRVPRPPTGRDTSQRLSPDLTLARQRRLSVERSGTRG